MLENITGNGYPVKLEAAHNIEYYLNTATNHYYTRYGTLLEVKTGVFQPSSTDQTVKVTREIWLDGQTRFYKNEGQYFAESDDTRIDSLSSGTLDTSEVVNIGSFNNLVKTTDITIKKVAGQSNVWEFTIEDGQELIIHEVPFYTTYTVTEPVQANRSAGLLEGQADNLYDHRSTARI